MKLLSLAALLLAVSCSTKPATCKADTDCTQATQTCQSGVCKSSIGLACNSNSDCGATLGCIQSKCAFRRVFTTSNAYIPGTTYNSSSCFPTDGTASCTFNSVTNADMACQDAATKANLGGKWMAWIADTNNSALGRVVPSHIADQDTADVYLIDGKTLVSGPVTNTISPAQSANWSTKPNFASPSDGTNFLATPDNHVSAINLSENMKASNIYNTWTGINNTDDAISSSSCSNWTANTTELNGVFGTPTTKNRNWHAGSSQACNLTNSLYCLEVNQ